jgi:Carboxypeptidase regulatory-like domain
MPFLQFPVRRKSLLVLAISLALLVFFLCSSGNTFAQSLAGTVQGTVTDPSGAPVPGATVEIRNPVSGYVNMVATGTDGGFTLTNVPFNNYHMTVTRQGFASYVHDINVLSSVPVALEISLKLASTQASVTVTSEASDLLQPTPSAETNVSVQLIQKLPVESQSSSLSSLITLSTPGVVADSNGLFHGLGDHASNSFSIDGQPITDQQSKVFSNQIPMGAVQSIKVYQNAPPPEFGDKTSLVIVATTRSGLGVTKPHGDVTASYGSFGTGNLSFDLSYGGQKWGNFILANGLNTRRFLDGPEFATIHDNGNQQNLFDRADFQVTPNDTINVNFFYTRSWFQTPNSYDAQDATAWSGLVVNNGSLGPNGLPVGPQDQRSLINTFNIAPTWTRVLGSTAVFTLGGWVRQDRYHYLPSGNPYADLTPISLQQLTIGQNRRLTNAGAHADLSYVKGMHNLKVGVQYMQTFLTENDNFGIVDPTFNAVCLNTSDGSPNTDPSITDPSQCTGALQPNPNFVPLLGCYDLTRLGTLPASDGCPSSQSGTYLFQGHTDVKELALYAQDTISIAPWTFNVGLRGDFYNGLTTASQAEPRLGVAYNIKKTNTVLRASYARTLETPFNENLILASAGCSNAVVNGVMSIVQGYPCITSAIPPGYRNDYQVGLQQAFGRYFVLSAEYFWKYTHNAYDFSVFGNTPITFPISWAKSKEPGFTVSANFPTFHGITAYVDLAHVAARFFQPQIAGIGVTPAGGTGVFRIDHDENFEQTTHIQYQLPWKYSPWISFNWRYDSGLVAGAVPFAADTTTPVDLTGLTADQQIQAGLFCGNQFPTLTAPLTTCAPSQYGSTLIKLPAPGTEDDDHNPPRIAPRHLFDLAVGDDNLFRGDRYRWSLQLTITNLTNKVTLYNFLSTFSGTHFVSPRSLTGELGFHF